MTNTPLRLDSNSSSVSGRSTPFSALPNTSLMAPTGHSTAQRACPMQWAASTRVATPSTTPMMSPSGQALMHEKLPMHSVASITGCSDGGVLWPSATDSASASRPARERLRRRNNSTAMATARAAAIIDDKSTASRT